jgi:transposase-like protein
MEPALGRRLSECLLPLIMGMLESKQDLLSFMNRVGQEALGLVVASEVEAMAGPRKKRLTDRRMYRWGKSETEFSLGGRRVTMPCPRIRERGKEAIGKGGREVRPPSVVHFQSVDPMPERVLNQILLGVTTRGYGPSLDPVSPDLRPHGTSRSSASRHFVSIARSKVQEAFSRRLEDVSLAAMMVDGIAVSRRGAILALGITTDGTKVPLGLEIGSTENAVLCTSLLQGLLDRGLKVDERILFVIDGGKGLRRAIEDVFGDAALVQRCLNHKRRNILQLLPERCHAYVNRALSDAWGSNLPKTAREIMKRLAAWLERDGHDTAAASLKEGLEETLTVVKLGLTGSLRAFFSTTNAIENVMGSVRDVTANVKRWRKGDMLRRWVGLAFVKAGKSFRRIKGFRGMPQLVSALRGASDAAAVDLKPNAA